MLPAPRIEQHGRLIVVRDDVLPGGTKMRALLPIMAASDAAEFVYASPAQGYAQVALAHCARLLGRRATVFTAARRRQHGLTERAAEAGAAIVQVSFGRLNVVQAHARRYAANQGALLMPFGLDVAPCIEAITKAARSLPVAPPEVWCAAGSGVLTRALQRAWPDAKVFAVVVGTLSSDTGRAERIVYPAPFDKAAMATPPFPSALNYDAKAWEIASAGARPGALFWNVAG